MNSIKSLMEEHGPRRDKPSHKFRGPKHDRPVYPDGERGDPPPCDRCGGTGFRLRSPEDTEDVECAECAGTGTL